MYSLQAYADCESRGRWPSSLFRRHSLAWRCWRPQRQPKCSELQTRRNTVRKSYTGMTDEQRSPFPFYELLCGTVSGPVVAAACVAIAAIAASQTSLTAMIGTTVLRAIDANISGRF